MLDLLKPLWQLFANAYHRFEERQKEFRRRHAEAYPETSEYRDENEALDQPTWAPLFTRK